ncbi:MAG: DUF3857 domain-containing protein [Planctomycetes bacterium]|nr:DUF3857 domain-containing protein [Planctomycetota bacterium]
MLKRPISALLFVLGVTLCATSLRAQINLEVANAAVDFSHWLAFEPDAAQQRVIKLVKAHPADPASRALVDVNRWVEDAAQDPLALGKALLEICDDGKKLSAFGPNARAFANEAAQCAALLGKVEVSHRIRAQLRGIQEWLVCGPFADSYEGDQHHETLAPELILQRSREYRGEFGPAKFQPWVRDNPLDDSVDLDRNTLEDGNGWFAWTNLNNNRHARQVMLDLDVGDGGVKAWLNGKLVFVRRAFADASRDDVALIDLPSGSSSLVVKFGRETRADIRVVDPLTRLPLADVMASLPEEETAIVLNGECAPASEPYRPSLQAFEKWLTRNPDEKGAIRALIALLQSWVGEEELALDHWHAAEDFLNQDTAQAKALRFFYYRSTDIICSDGERNKERRAALEWLKENVSDEVRPSFELAQLIGQEGRHRDAANAFEALLKKKDHWALRMGLSAFYESTNMQAEARDALVRALASAGGIGASMPYRLAKAYLDMAQSDGDYELSDRIVEQLRSGERGQSWELLSERLSKARRAGIDKKVVADDVEALIEQFERHSGYTTSWVYALRKDLALAQGDLNRALECLDEEWLGVLRNRDNFHTQRGELLLQHDRVAAAAEEFHRALEISPAAFTARHHLERLSNKHLVLSHPLNSVVDASNLDAIKAEDFPKAGAAMLLDEAVWEVNLDGSFTSWEQRVVKILRHEAVDQHGRKYLRGTVMKVRTLLADGTEREPTTVQGNSIEFPNVEPGVAVHWLTRDTHRASSRKILEGTSFSFAESDLSMPTALSRLVLVVPQGFVLNYRESNMDDVSFEESEDDMGRRVLVWELRKPRSIETEPLMPSRDELLPSLEFTRNENTWDDQLRSVLRSADMLPKSSWLIRQTMKEVLERFEGQSSASRAEADLQKAEALYTWVNQNIKVESWNNHPHLTLVERRGDRGELFRALMHAADLPLVDVWVGGKADSVRDMRFNANAGFYQHIFYIAGEYVDLSERQAPFGACNPSVAGARAIRVDHQSGEVTLFELPKNLGEDEPLRVMLAFGLEAGSRSAKVSGSIVQSREGWQAREDDREASESERKRALQRELVGTLPGLDITEFEVSDVEALEEEYRRTFEGSLAQAFVEQDGALVITPHLQNTAESLSFALERESRSFDMMLTSQRDMREELYYMIPEGFALSELPEDHVQLAAPFTYRLSYRVEDGYLVVRRSVKRVARRIAAANYQSFRQQVKAIGEAEKRKITLVKVN